MAESYLRVPKVIAKQSNSHAFAVDAYLGALSAKVAIPQHMASR